MAEPTPYDLEQDARIETIESLVTAEYQPPEGTEYSFPVANQGITQDQFRLMHLGQANGMIHGNNGIVNDSPDSTGWRYYLDRHDSDSETNQRNTLILRAGPSAESIVEGFYHRLTEDLELPFPPVTTTTVYHVTITYDPRDFKTNPVKIQVYPGTPPTSHGLVHVVLYKVERGPNQILTRATITRYRPYTAGLLSVQNRNQLPDPAAYPAGTLVVPSAEGHGIYIRQNGGLKWLDVLGHLSEKPGPWYNVVDLFGSYTQDSSNRLQARIVPGGIQLSGRIRSAEGFSGSVSIGTELFRLPNNWRPKGATMVTCWNSSEPAPRRFRVKTNGVLEMVAPGMSGSINYIDFDTIIAN